MPDIYYKIDILSALKEAGYSSYRLRKENLLSQSTLQKFREGKPVSWENLSTVCELLDCQPGDIINFIPKSVEERILELTEEEEEKLREYYDGKWYDDDSYEEKVCLRYEENISNAIIRLKDDAEDEDETELYEIFNAINFKYSMRHIQNSWDEIEEEYDDCLDQIHEFFDSYIEEFNEEMEEEKNDYIEESVKEELDAMKYDIQEQALKEYLGDDEE